MILRALIIDDEPLAHTVIVNYAQEVPFLEIVGQVYSASEALAFLGENQVDLLFLDIQMPKVMGLDLLKILNPKPIVIVTSAYQEYALESFELDVCDYLLKPYRLERFLKAVQKAVQFKQFQTTPASLQTRDNHTQAAIWIKSDKKQLLLEVDQISHLESYGNYVKVWSVGEYHLSPITMGAILDQLPSEKFLRIHKSFAVNLGHLKMVEGHQLTLQDGSSLPVGRSFKKAVQERIGN